MNKVKKAIIWANISAISLVIIKLTTWIITWSLAVLSSALDSWLDFLVSLFNLYVFKKSDQKHCETYNYWQWKIQWIWAVFEWLIVATSGWFLIYFWIEKIIKILNHQKVTLEVEWWLYIMLISITITWILVTYLNKVYKETKDLTIKADSLHYKTDLFSNWGIIISLLIIKLTWFIVIDSIISIIIWIYIISSSKDIIIEWIHMIMDRKIDDELIEKIDQIIKNTDKKINGYHLLKTRQSWSKIFIDFHLVFDTDIKLIDAHSISDIIEEKIKQENPTIKTIILAIMLPVNCFMLFFCISVIKG